MMALLGQLGIRLDPVLANNFLVSLIDSTSPLAVASSLALSAIFDVVLGGFTECSGLDTSLEVEEVREGGRNGTVLKFPTRVTWTPITLKKGVGAGTALWDWHYSFCEGRGRRRDGVIVLLSELHVPNNIWFFRRGLPTRYTGPSMNASQSTVAIESMEIAHEGLFQVPFVGLGAGAVSVGAQVGVRLR